MRQQFSRGCFPIIRSLKRRLVVGLIIIPLEKSSSKRLIWEVIRLLEECGKITMPRFYPERATSLASGLVSGLADVHAVERIPSMILFSLFTGRNSAAKVPCKICAIKKLR
ncbi:hypothetical protein Dsin_032317 [Dipteronia sinensis]|uniref:Uncharacterized protein n=1 Tax=Dipteronia sinensis TaxID=43782 RepID=A0AAD9ZMR0_9ROSI|nr:hypothetical protein Dsin_032317 [Dipteronia sinensis]